MPRAPITHARRQCVAYCSDLFASDVDDEDVDKDETQPDDDCMNQLNVIMRLFAIAYTYYRGYKMTFH